MHTKKSLFPEAATCDWHPFPPINLGSLSAPPRGSADFLVRLLFTKTYKTMKEFMDIWVKPFQECGLTRREKWIMAVAVPAAYVAVVILSHLLP